MESLRGGLTENAGVANRRNLALISVMPTLEKIEKDVKQLPKADQEALRDWLENMVEDALEFTDEFKAKIERGEQDIREGRVRFRKVPANRTGWDKN